MTETIEKMETRNAEMIEQFSRDLMGSRILDRVASFLTGQVNERAGRIHGALYHHFYDDTFIVKAKPVDLSLVIEYNLVVRSLNEVRDMSAALRREYNSIEDEREKLLEKMHRG